jgi:hypothetical protein
MKLNPFAAQLRMQMFSELSAQKPPSSGVFDEVTLRRAFATGKKPQMGSTRYEPSAIHFEFIFPDPNGSSVVLVVSHLAPERIVFMPVPSWVVESIWQGEINGSAQFESDALQMLEEFRTLLSPELNAAHFETRTKVAREG